MKKKIAIFKPFEYDLKYLKRYMDNDKYELVVVDKKFSLENLKYIKGCDAISTFVNDICDAEVVKELSKMNIKCILNRCAGYDNVDLKQANIENIKVFRVPSYSPASIAEFAMGHVLSLVRSIPTAYNRTTKNNFSLEGIDSFALEGKTIGVIGTGQIGQKFIRILNGFGSNVIAYDKYPNYENAKKLNFKYVELDEIWKKSVIISLHCPATPETNNLIREENILKMRDNVIIVNTSRGTLLNAKDALKYIKNGKIKGLGIDVYEKEKGVFFYNLQNKHNKDAVLFELLNTPMVLVTAHQSFFTDEALTKITQTTLNNYETYLSNLDTSKPYNHIREEVSYDSKLNKIINP